MQHALMRLWLEAKKASPHNADGDASAAIVLKLSDYEAMNGMAGRWTATPPGPTTPWTPNCAGSPR